MKHFPDFVRNPANEVADAPEGMKGYLFEGADGTQVVFWENVAGGESPMHSHDFWEYAIVLEGHYEGTVDGKPVTLGPGDECAIPPGAKHGGHHSAGYRAIDVWAGPRVQRRQDAAGNAK